MNCAIKPAPMAHQWRNGSAPSSKGALREKGNGARHAITLFPRAHLWRNSAASSLAATMKKEKKIGM
jgi:hypothetical protein